jgi:Zn-dependent peptidase ImmA (M78 family)
MKRLPKSVTILGRKIPIKIVSSKKMLELYPMYQHAPQGLWDSGYRVIYINADYPLIDQRYTLLHELSHSVMTCVGLDLIIDANIQEIIVQSMATMLEDILCQHKTLA